MLAFLDKARRVLWAFVELAFVALLAILLIHLLLGKDAGGFVQSVADNVTQFANAMQTPSLVGLAIVIGLIYLINRRLG